MDPMPLRRVAAAAALVALSLPTGTALAQQTGGTSPDADAAEQTDTAEQQRAQPRRSPQLNGRARIRAAQKALGLRADGVAGRRTRAAIRRFQRRHDLPVTGRLGDDTMRALGVIMLPAKTRYSEEEAVEREIGEVAVTALAAARDRIGAGYASGGTGPDAFDCSGLMVDIFDEAGEALPRTSFDQFTVGKAIDRDEIRPGDLVFFDTSGPGASHVGIATGKSTAISATSSGGVMEHSTRDSYWGGSYVGARRLK
jgi:cell wall-associated NlpC family hydrolase